MKMIAEAYITASTAVIGGDQLLPKGLLAAIGMGR